MAAQPRNPLPSAFFNSYNSFIDYPKTLVPRSIDEEHDGELFALYRKRIEDRQSSAEPLLLEDSVAPGAPPVLLPQIIIRDIFHDGSVLKKKIVDETRLGKHLAGFPKLAQAAWPDRVAPDPRCRFVFLPARDSTSCLQISKKMLLRLFSYHQVMPPFLDFLLIYGSRESEERAIHYSGFRTDIVSAEPHPGNIIPALTRSGYRYQISYNTKTVSTSTRDFRDRHAWSYLQASIHHQFDLDTGNQLWIVGDPHRLMSTRISKIFRDTGHYPARFKLYPSAFLTTLRTHLVFINAAIKDWRLIIEYAEENLTSTQHFAMIHDPRIGPNYTTADLQDLQLLQRQTRTALVVLESNEGTYTSLRRFYNEQITPLLERNLLTLQEAVSCRQSLRQFVSQLDELIYETNMHMKCLVAVERAYSERMTLLLQHLDAQKMAKEEDLNASLWALARRGENDSVAMRIITFITLIYLPAAFVSTFFSSGVLEYSQPPAAAAANSSTPTETLLQAPATSEPTEGSGKGRVETISPMFILWGQTTGIITGITMLSAVLWLFWERRANQLRMLAFQKQWPELSERVKAFS